MIWNHLSFLIKVTIRNLFRFKKRFFMTILGIAGCTALLLTGFGLRDSISGTLPEQYYGLHTYHLFIKLIDPGLSTDKSNLNDSLPSLLDDWLYVTEIKVEVDDLDKNMTTYLFVPEDAGQTSKFINFRERKNQSPLIFPEAGTVILTEKIAAKLGVRSGDSITVRQDQDQPVQLLVSGVTENYLYNYIYMAPEDYRTAFHSDPKFDMILGKSIQGENMTEDQEKELTTELLEQDRVLSATAIASISREFKTAMKNLDAVVMVIILFACLLNFIVLYNLININITERTREIATIKVLGFLPREVSAYMNREIFALTGIGILIGLVGGIFLHQFTIQNAEVDIVMYVREIQLASFAWSVLLTILFSLVINLAIRRRLRRIKMVESLKSVE